MDGSPGTLRKALEDWLEQNYSPGYTSCVKINGRPILPPLMSEARRIEMRRLRDIAVHVENKIKLKKGSITQEESAGGEAMYEGTEEDLHFANSLPTSLAPNVEESIRPASHAECNEVLNVSNTEQETLPQSTSDMLKEFDPLTGDRSNEPLTVASLDITPTNANKRSNTSVEKTSSKPSSAESSMALSYSTDLNNYMDVTESSADVSLRCSDSKSVGGTGTTTPSTMRPESCDDKFQLGVPWRDGKTTYEELNNYLDSLLSNSNSSRTMKLMKDKNQNVVSSSVSQGSQETVTPPSLVEYPRPLSGNPPPLTSPGGRLQTRMMADSSGASPPQNEKCSIESTTDFLQNCALSPVVKQDVQSSYQQKVQSYLENLMAHEETSDDLRHLNLSMVPQNVKEDTKQTFLQLQRNFVNGDVPKLDSEGSNGNRQSPPRLVRSNSYTLDSPSPMLLAHIEAELQKNVKNDTRKGDKAMLTQSLGPSRRVWDTDAAKNMPNWFLKQSNSSSANPKMQSPKKVLNRSLSAQPHSVGNIDCKETPASKQGSKVATNQPKSRKSSLIPQQREGTHKMPETNPQKTTTVSSKTMHSEDAVRTLLLELQLQHNQEMEELINRQRKEKEAIRLALLAQQQANSKQWSGDHDTYRPNPCPNLTLSPSSQSPPSKDKGCLLERRNTSPSLYDKEISMESQNGLLQSKSSSISVEDVSSSNNNMVLIDLGNEKKTESNDAVNKKRKIPSEPQNVTDMTVATYCERQLELPGAFSGSSDMISSFPPRDILCHSDMNSMTRSLPPEILSLHFSNTQLTYQNAGSVSCNTQSSSISINKSITVTADVASMPHNVMSSALASNVADGSPRSKRRSWCSRQLFPDDCLDRRPDWVSQFQEIQKNQAASKIQAGVRGYLTRRLLKTERVQNCITTIRDTIVCALQLQRECAPHVEPSDLQLHGRLIQQLSAACEDLHNIFMGLPVSKRMAIIAVDRERLRSRTPRSRSSTGSRPLSRATQIALQRKMNQSDPLDSMSVHSRSSSSSRSRRRSWATVESRSKPSQMPACVANNCEVVSGCLSRSSAPTSLPLQRSASAGSSRKPWR